MSRWSELMKQPKAKIVTVHNQLDDIDIRGKKFLVSDRVTPSFDSFVTDVNEKLAPPGVALRKIYTAQGGHPVRSVSALTVSKEYTASPKRFDKNRADKLQSQSKNQSKKSSAASSEGYHSDDGGRGRINSNSKKLAGHRMSLLDRQKLYAKPRSHSEGASPAQSRSVSPAKKPQTRIVRKPKTPVKRKPISRPPKKAGKSLSFNERGKKRLEEKFPDNDSDDSRVPTPPGKRRVAFRGQYIFVTDDEEEDSDGGKSRNASKASTAKSRRSNRTVSKSPSKYSARSRISEGDEDDYYSDDEDDYKNSAVTKKSTRTTKSKLGESTNHLTPNRSPSRFSTKSNKSTKSSKSRKSSSRQSTASRKSADSGRNTGSDSDEDYNNSRNYSAKSKQTTRNTSAISNKSDDSDDERAASRISKYSKYSQRSKQGSNRSDSDEYYEDDYNDSKDKASVKSRTGASARSRKSTGGSQGSNYSYSASRGNSGARSVADSAETKVNTPVDMRDAKQVDSDDYYYSDDEYKKSNASKRN